MTGKELQAAYWDALRNKEDELFRVENQRWSEAKHNAKWHVLREVLPKLIPAGTIIECTEYHWNHQQHQTIEVAKVYQNGKILTTRGVTAWVELKYGTPKVVFHKAFRTHPIIQNITTPDAPVAKNANAQLDLFA